MARRVSRHPRYRYLPPGGVPGLPPPVPLGVLHWNAWFGPPGEGEGGVDSTAIHVTAAIRVLRFLVTNISGFAYTGADSTTLMLTKNGNDTGLVASFSAGDAAGAAKESTVGRVDYAVGDRLSWRGDATDDNTGYPLQIFLVYEAVDGQFLTSTYADIGSASGTDYSTFGAEYSPADAIRKPAAIEDTDVVPFAVTLSRLGLDAGSHPEADPYSSVAQPYLNIGDSATPQGPSVMRPAMVRGINGPINVVIPAATVPLNPTRFWTRVEHFPTFFAERLTYAYRVAPPHDNAMVFGCSLDFLHASGTFGFKRPSYAPIGGAFLLGPGGSGGNELVSKAAWPLSGTFQFLRAAVNFLDDSGTEKAPNDDVFTFGFRKNGVTVLSVSMANNASPKFGTQDTVAVHVNAGDYVNFVATGVGAATTRPNGSLSILFTPD